LPSPEHQPGLLPVWLYEQGVNVVIAGGMGAGAQNILKEKGIKSVIGVTESDPEKAVLNYLNGNLTAGGNTCDHGDGDGHTCSH
jgi:predicted Fe-Mo cluster-binding NifX family protein